MLSQGIRWIKLQARRNKKGEKVLPFAPLWIKVTFDPLQSKGLCLLFKVNHPETTLRSWQADCTTPNKVLLPRPEEGPNGFGDALRRPSRDGKDVAKVPDLGESKSVNNNSLALKGKDRPGRKACLKFDNGWFARWEMIISNVEGRPEQWKIFNPLKTVGFVGTILPGASPHTFGLATVKASARSSLKLIIDGKSPLLMHPGGIVGIPGALKLLESLEIARQ